MVAHVNQFHGKRLQSGRTTALRALRNPLGERLELFRVPESPRNALNPWSEVPLRIKAALSTRERRILQYLQPDPNQGGQGQLDRSATHFGSVSTRFNPMVVPAKTAQFPPFVDARGTAQLGSARSSLPNGRSGASTSNISSITVGVGSIELFKSTHRTLLTSRTTVEGDPSDLQLVRGSWTGKQFQNRLFFQ